MAGEPDEVERITTNGLADRQRASLLLRGERGCYDVARIQ